MNPMNSFPSEKELCDTLRTGARLVKDCAQGLITLDEFLADYGSFYMQHGLDGHESDEVERALLQEHSIEVALHKAVWDEVISKITADEFMNRPEVIQAGFIGHVDALGRIRNIARQYAETLG
jgi:hypothetical protein